MLSTLNSQLTYPQATHANRYPYFTEADTPHSFSVKYVNEHELCPYALSLLSHNEYMTVHLQRIRACSLHIDKIYQRYGGKQMERGVLLKDQHGLTHIVAKLIVNLTFFCPTSRRRLIESEEAFGNLLTKIGVAPSFHDRKYFLVDSPLHTDFEPYSRCRHGYCGRSHMIRDTSGRVLATVYEVLT